MKSVGAPESYQVLQSESQMQRFMHILLSSRNNLITTLIQIFKRFSVVDGYSTVLGLCKGKFLKRYFKI